MPRKRQRRTTTGGRTASASPSVTATPAQAEAGEHFPTYTGGISQRRWPGGGWASTFVPTATWADGDTRIPHYYEMWRSDTACSASLSAIVLTILKHRGQYTHPDRRIAEFVNESLEQVKGGLRRLMRGLLSALPMGYSVAERVPEVNGRIWTYAAIRVVHPLTLFPDGIRPVPDSPTGELEFTQSKHQIGGKQTELEPWRLVYWPYAQVFDEQIYGCSMFRPAYKPWYILEQILNWWPMWAERFAQPIGFANVPQGQTYSPRQQQEIPNTELAMEFFDNLTAGSSLAVQQMGADAAQWVVQFLEAGAGGGDAYEKLLYVMDGRIFRALLMPRLAIEEAQYGTRAQADVNLDFFHTNIEGIRAELGEVLVQQLAKQLIIWNFGANVGDWGEWRWDEIEPADLETWSRVLTNLASSGFARPTTADEQKTREVFHELLAPESEGERVEVAKVAASVRRYGAVA